MQLCFHSKEQSILSVTKTMGDSDIISNTRNTSLLVIVENIMLSR
jgi:hypothetical protein